MGQKQGPGPGPGSEDDATSLACGFVEVGVLLEEEDEDVAGCHGLKRGFR